MTSFKYADTLECLKECDRRRLEEVFENSSDEIKFKAVHKLLKSLNFELSKSEPSEKSDAVAQSCFKECELLLNENKNHSALKKLNEALSYAKDEKLAAHLANQRRLFEKKSGLAIEIKKAKCTSSEISNEEETSASSCVGGAFLLPQLFRGSNKEIEVFSKSLHLDYTESLGRHVTALQDIYPGCILGLETPLASVLHLPCKYTHCSECFAKSHFLIPCQHCTQALYCNESCLATAWTSHHSFECQRASGLETAGLCPVDMLAVRLLSLFGADKILEMLASSDCKGESRRCAGFDATGKFRSNTLLSFYHTFSNVQCWSFEELFLMCVKAVFILKACGLECHPGAGAIGGFLLRCLHGIPLIAHEISERCNCLTQFSSDHGIGLGIFSALSLINHSCDQNMVKHYQRKLVVMRAIKKIPKGSQILDSYGPHFIADPRPQRTAVLKSRFKFRCECPACASDLPVQQSLPWSLEFKPGRSVQEALRGYLDNGRVEWVAVKELEETISEMDERGKNMCQQYFVLQQMIKVLYASQSNFYACKKT